MQNSEDEAFAKRYGGNDSTAEDGCKPKKGQEDNLRNTMKEVEDEGSTEHPVETFQRAQESSPDEATMENRSRMFRQHQHL